VSEEKPKRKGTYYQVTDGEWVPVGRKGNKDQCCDCGLVHRVNYRINDKGGIEVQVFRDDRATGAVRKSFKFEKESED
jgi:hypothetical protein